MSDTRSTYRYTLHRIVGMLGEGTLLWVMLNPSTADEREDDPTIRRCIRFTRDLGFGVMRVVNLYALRATSPSALRLTQYPIGPSNDATIRDEVAELGLGDAIMAAWGSHAPPSRVADVRRIIEEARSPEVPVLALKVNADGNAGHPLYLSASTEPAPYGRATYLPTTTSPNNEEH